MLKGFKFQTSNGAWLSIVETQGFNRIGISISEPPHSKPTATIELTRDDWMDLCELRYKVTVDDSPEPPRVNTLSDESFVPVPGTGIPFVPAIRAERVAGEENNG